MATNYIRIEIDPCQPDPVNGYRVIYRPLGSNGAYRESDDRFFPVPMQDTLTIDIVDELDPAGTEYEGFVQSDCGNGVYSNAGGWQTAPGGGSDSDSGGGSDSDSGGGEPQPPNWWIHGSWWDYFAINLTGPTFIVGPYTKFDYGDPLAHEGFIDWPALIAANPGVQVNVTVESNIEDMQVGIRVYDLTDSVYLYDGGGTNSFGVGFVPEVGHLYQIEAYDQEGPQHILF